MILQWKRISAAEHRTRWQGQELRLRAEQARWHLYADGRHVGKDTWPTARAAMEYIDHQQQRIVHQAMTSLREQGGAHARA